jgi:hypothetical protein
MQNRYCHCSQPKSANPAIVISLQCKVSIPATDDSSAHAAVLLAAGLGDMPDLAPTNIMIPPKLTDQ